MLKKTLLLVVLVALVALGFGAVSAQEGVTELTIWWAEWDPANFLQQIGNEYAEETGITVNVVQTPWGEFYNRVAAEWAARGNAFDMVVGDSQWLGQAVTEGHYLNLTDFLVGEGIADTVTPATLQYYGEYPSGSGQYYAYPTEGDADGWAYRKDLFEDPDNMAAFEAAYGYPLAVPETWEQLRDIAEFFTHPDEGLYGVGVYTQIDYDAITMGYENTMFSYGGNWWEGEDYNVLGIVNSPENVAALELYAQLYDFAPPGTNNAFFAEMNDVFINGQAAMIMNYFAFFPALANPEINPYAESTGYFANPAGPDGQRFAALGGQGTSVNAYISEERQAAAIDFLRWFAQEENQARWGELGGYTCNSNVLESEEFLSVAPFNPAFAETMTFVKDFFNIPEFGSLLPITQNYLHGFIVGGEGTAQEALDNMAAEMDEVLAEAGYGA